MIRRLKHAASVPEVKEQMTVEDEFLDYLKNWSRSERFKGRKEVEKEMETTIAQMNKIEEELIKKDEELIKKDEELVKKEEELKEERKKNETYRLKLQQAGLL